MAIGSGLGSQLMAAAETTPGTPVTVTKTFEFLSEDLKHETTWLEGKGLKAGVTAKRSGRTVRSRFTVSGGFSVEAVDKGLGLLLKHALGSAAGPTQIAATTAYRQIHTPGDKTLLGLTLQVGRPQPNGTVRAHTYTGCKILEWEFSCSDGEMAMWKFTVDGTDESVATALATASYPTAMTNFTFADSSAFTLGGTASTTAGLMTVTSGVAVTTLVKGLTITGKTPMATERYGFGNAGIKGAAIQNDLSEWTIKLDGEYTSRTEIYDIYKAGTATAFLAEFSHGLAGTAIPFKLGFIAPATKIKDAAPNVSGPDIVGQTINLEAYDDDSGTNAALQVEFISTDTSL